jgi:hypothetical protein
MLNGHAPRLMHDGNMPTHDNRYEITAIAAGTIVAVSVTIFIEHGIIGQMAGQQLFPYSYEYEYGYGKIILYSILNGIGIWSGILCLEKRWIIRTPCVALQTKYLIVCAVISTALSLAYVGRQHSIRWYADEGIYPLLAYFISFISCVFVSYLTSVLLKLFSKS